MKKPLPVCGVAVGLIALCLGGCVKYVDEDERKAVSAQGGSEPPTSGVLAGASAGATAGTPAGVVSVPDAEVLPELSVLTSGRFILGLAFIVDLRKPTTFIADLEFELSEDRSTGRVVRMSLDPRACELADAQRSSVGETLVFEGPAELGETARFTADFGERNVPGPANCISGSNIQAVIIMRGEVKSPDVLCGTVDGQLIQPYSSSLGGSTFAAVRVPEGMTAEEYVRANPTPKSCDDFAPETPVGGADQP